MASQRQSPTDIQREALTTRYGELTQEYVTAMKELGQLHGSAKLRKEREVESIEQEMYEVDAKLKALEQQSRNRNRKQLNLEKDLQEIDFIEVKKVLDRILCQIDRDEGGNASFLLQRSLLREGRLCLLQIKAQLGNLTKDLKYYPIEFSVGTELNYIGLLNCLASHLGIEPIADPVDYSSSIQQAIVRSLQSNSIVLIEIHKWGALPSQREVLYWFLEKFWKPLIAQLPKIATTYSRVKFITVFVVDGEIESHCLEYCCTHDKCDGQKIIDLPLQDWTEDVIFQWLGYVTGQTIQQNKAIAKRIHEDSGGIPMAICSALKDEFAKS